MKIIDVDVEICSPHPKKNNYFLTGRLTVKRTYSNTYSWRAMANEDFIIENIDKDIKLDKSSSNHEMVCRYPDEAKSAVARAVKLHRLKYITGMK